MSADERAAFLKKEPKATDLLRPYVGSREHINGGERWILTLGGVSPQTLRTMPKVLDIIDQVRRYRLGELPARDDPDGENNRASALSLALARTPTAFHVTVIPTQSFMVIPEVSSERRPYLPIARLQPPTVPSNKLLVALDANLHHFALITSRMHMAWVAYIGGRLKSDYQYSPGINYNPFPQPILTPETKKRLGQIAQTVLDARSAHPGAPLVDCTANVMPANLRRAHEVLDLAVDRTYRGAAFGSDRERVEHLFGFYEKQVTPLPTLSKPRRVPRARKATK